ncbi:Endolytic peptidoglycan transglycosylase RlpA [Burkholderiales bacterium 8X]|nr:Endolytic peptidoglycan transglycosylase RlpA [Burkholderiales bacterium 8X]
MTDWRGRVAGACIAVSLIAVLAGCASGSRGGRDGPGARTPSGLDRTPDAEPRVEPIRGAGGTSKPYVVAGRSYVPITDDRPLRETGLASWYGNQFHGRATASGEAYDMYAMTAAHKTLPLPSYVRVRNPANGREAIVRVNDRGPFHDDRVIDLSYTAALKLDLLRGVAPVEIERITNEDVRTGAWRRGGPDATAVAQGAAIGGTTASAQFGSASGFASTSIATSTPIGAAGRMPAEDNAGSGNGTVVPMALTSPVVAAPRAEVRDLETLAPLAPAEPPRSSPATNAGSAMRNPATSSTATDPPIASASVSSTTSTSAMASTMTATSPSDTSRALGGYWVQLGAFSQKQGVERLQSQVVATMPALASMLNVFDERGTYRLQAGPYASRDLARDTAEQVRNGLQLAPIIVERR